MSEAIVNCATCGMPGKVKFDAAGEVAAAYFVCGHVKVPAKSEATPPAHDVPRDLAAAEAELSNAIYAAARLLEDLEHAGLVHGNGHHMRQAVAESAVELLRERWTGPRP